MVTWSQLLRSYYSSCHTSSCNSLSRLLVVTSPSISLNYLASWAVSDCRLVSLYPVFWVRLTIRLVIIVVVMLMYMWVVLFILVHLGGPAQTKF